ncbi:MAG: ferrochelatase [Firmicutes bacterium]|nr:ferrochelatase [Alicyclobacillaceae bacterium]MCL6497805.1 ferrochelatase [Bacillota bacterium]
MAERAVLLMAYGSPRRLEDLAAYYTHIRHGRPPSPEALEELASRYRAIGGSPLVAISERQRRGLEARLNQAAEDGRWRVYLGFRHAPPFLADVVADMARDGVTEGVALALAPHYHPLSVGAYLEAVRQAAERFPSLRLRGIAAWHLEPGLIAWWARQVKRLAVQVPQGSGPVHWVFTAHSLPAPSPEYRAAVEATAAAVARQSRLGAFEVAFQSRPRAPGEWLGPDLLERLPAWGRAGGTVAVVPVGFVSDHLETLYDLDIQAREAAERLRLGFVRAAAPNDDPDFVEVLAAVVEREAQAL